MTKKIFTIACVNLLIILGLLTISEFVLFKLSKNDIKETLSIRQKMNKINTDASPFTYKYSFDIGSFNYDDIKSQFRKPEGLNYKKKPVVIFGCSFAYGDGLNVKDTFSYKLSHISKRPVYNRAQLGWCSSQMLYQLRRNDFYSEVKPPEYIIYTLMSAHLLRLFEYPSPPPYHYIGLRYKLTNEGFKEIHPFLKPLWSLYTVNHIQQIINSKVIPADYNHDRNLQYFYLMLKECKRLSKIHCPNSKFVILIYRDQEVMFIDNQELLKKLNDDGFTIIDTKDLVPNVNLYKSDEYKTIDNEHPSGKAWDLIVPAVIKKLNL